MAGSAIGARGAENSLVCLLVVRGVKRSAMTDDQRWLQVELATNRSGEISYATSATVSVLSLQI